MEIRLQDLREQAEPVAVTMRTPGQRLRARRRLLPHRGAARRCGGPRVGARTASTGDVDQEYNVVTVTSRRPVDLDQHRRVVAASTRAAASAARRRSTRWRSAARPSPRVRSSPGPRSCACPTCCATPRRSSTPPVGCTPRASSPPTASSRSCARTSAGTTRSTRWSATAAHDGCAPALELQCCVVSGPAELRDRAEGRGRRHPRRVGAVSAPSSLAVATAERFDQTLVGFLRDGRGNVYTHPERISTWSS